MLTVIRSFIVLNRISIEYFLVAVISQLVFLLPASSQLQWKNVDAEFGELPSGFHVFRATGELGNKPVIAYYAIMNARDRGLQYLVDTTLRRRITPNEYFQRNNQPLLVVNTTFFSLATHENRNLVVSGGKILTFNTDTITARANDSVVKLRRFSGGFGITTTRKPDIAWTFTDSFNQRVRASQVPVAPRKIRQSIGQDEDDRQERRWYRKHFRKWKMETAVGGGPVLIQKAKMAISNEPERRFTGNMIYNKEPRTAVGYTQDGRIIFLVIEGRHPGIAEGATLVETAELLLGLGCVEGLNLDGGGSSCMLINGIETIRPSGNAQRPVPAVLIVKTL